MLSEAVGGLCKPSSVLSNLGGERRAGCLILTEESFEGLREVRGVDVRQQGVAGGKQWVRVAALWAGI